MKEQMLVLVAPASLRDMLVDCLMASELVSGFNLQDMDGYSREHSRFDLAEQVAGYRRMVRFEVIHREEVQQALLDAVTDACEAGQVRYWISALDLSGHLGGKAP
jgi:hypothetical protein